MSTKNNNNKYKWLNEESRLFLDRGYLREGQTAEERIREIANHAEKLSGVKGFADKFEHYMSKGFYSLSSPVWANYGNDRGLPVSCFGSYLDDDMGSILETHAEVGMLSKFGGGTSGYFGKLRPRGSPIQDKGKSFGSVHFMQLFDTLVNVVSQGSVRRGYFTAYLPIDHEDFDEFIGIGGDDGHPIQNITHAVTVSDDFLNKMIEGDEECRRRWAKVLEARGEVGYPYIFFSDTVNKSKPKCFANDEIYASNMCAEIALPSNEDQTFVCVLSSLNLLHYDEWKETDAVEVLTIFLDTVCTEFLLKLEEMEETRPQAADYMKRARDFCEKWRALGLGVLGWHSYLQSKMIPFESREAAKLNVEIFKTIKDRALKASTNIVDYWANEWGVKPEEIGFLNDDGETYRRNSTLMAVAPTKSSSFILGGVSQGIEPEFSNFYIKDLSKIKTTRKNPYLEKLLIEKGKNTEQVWDSIKKHDGSVQHLDFLSELEKGVFKTFIEINPTSVIDQAAVRQVFIDQAQSLNLMVDPSLPTKEINQLYLHAWKMGVKTLYYQYNLNAAQSLQRERYMTSSCSACEG